MLLNCAARVAASRAIVSRALCTTVRRAEDIKTPIQVLPSSALSHFSCRFTGELQKLGWEYLVKWLGYAHSENTWEAAKHVVSA